MQHITTNATLLNEKLIQQMRELNFNSFQIPIDGNEKHHNCIKHFEDKRGTYRTVMDNINLIAEIIPNVNIILRINYDKQTLKNIQAIIKDLSEQSKSHITVDFQRVWQVQSTEKEQELLKNAKDIFLSNGFRSNFWAYKPGTFHRCYADKYHYYAINYDGKVYKCTARDYGEDKMIGTLLSSGKIEWNNNRLSVLYDKATFENERCMKCKKLPLCMGPCIQKNYESVTNNTTLPCLGEGAEYSLNSFVIEEAKKRNLIES